MTNTNVDIGTFAISPADTGDTGICNLALARIGCKRITSLATDSSNEAVKCRDLYISTRDALLRVHPWSFAITTVSLTPTTAVPVSKHWKYEYSLPSDFIRIVPEGHRHHTLMGNTLFSNDSIFILEYVQRVTDTTQYDALFVEVLALAMALALVMPLTGDKNLRIAVGQEYEGRLAKAWRVDRSETSKRQDLSWAEARRFSIGGR